MNRDQQKAMVDVLDEIAQEREKRFGRLGVEEFPAEPDTRETLIALAVRACTRIEAIDRRKP